MKQAENTEAIYRVTDAPLENEGAILEALQKVLTSPEFEGTERVQSFLDYIVRETVAGRGDRIRGKTILEDVYERSAHEGNDPLALVRVDAGRLRRHLTAYYAGSGADARIRIGVDPGGYAPKFTQLAQPEGSAPAVRSLTPWRLSAAAACVVVVALAANWWITELPGEAQTTATPVPGTQTTSAAPETEPAIREAMFSVSPARLQAANLSAKARALLFPALEPKWQTHVLGMFHHIIDLDPRYFAGYAGAAQTGAFIAFTLPPGPEREQHIANAQQAARTALDLAPDQGWSHSAAATVSLALQDYERVFAQSARAIALAGDDVDILVFDALFSLFGGDFERARLSAEKVDRLKRPQDDFPDLSILAAANFHLGEFETARDNIMKAAMSGDPISPISLGYIIAIHQRLGQDAIVDEMLHLLDTAWPAYPLDALFGNLYRKPEDGQAVIQALRDAGWEPPAPDMDAGQY